MYLGVVAIFSMALWSCYTLNPHYIHNWNPVADLGGGGGSGGGGGLRSQNSPQFLK